MTAPSPSEIPGSITVSGHGLVQTTPDYFTINLGIEATQATVREAYAQAEEALNAVSATLLAQGVARELISSSALNVRVETRWQEGSGSVVTGYTVSSTLAVSLRYDQSAEDVIAAVVDTGNNNVRITGLTPVVSDPTSAQDAARAVAWTDARRAAELYAHLAGRSLGEPSQIIEGQISDSAPRPMMARAEMTLQSSPMAIEPGQSSITMTVQVTWLLN
ncbi:SIMPL domain-containing protein [Arthrobacter psychrolactophilus]|uniref:SIMPL domain-containing protein n=1 Tax=Arthrobacter psychrolactophilus TaxID=92442 RepID=A0A2V5JDP1_9MICC|nr:SIMPL domain-containing protein [Arthrobacter psychrolactophilus]PYI37377.1 SIMPL domain-containing protein [Arthrobacter psychrolactophilus]